MVKADKLNKDGYIPKEDERGMFITVFCDGSFCDKTKAWGIGIWVKHSDQSHNQADTYSFGGVGVFNNSTEVEAHGIHIAIGMLREINTEGKILSLQADCTAAFESFSEAVIARSLGLKKCKFKHVRAHTGQRNNRSIVNDIVDRLAKTEMRKHRDKYLKETNNVKS